VFVIDSVNFI